MSLENAVIYAACMYAHDPMHVYLCTFCIHLHEYIHIYMHLILIVSVVAGHGRCCCSSGRGL
jgi:hypothetical protein